VGQCQRVEQHRGRGNPPVICRTTWHSPHHRHVKRQRSLTTPSPVCRTTCKHRNQTPPCRKTWRVRDPNTAVSNNTEAQGSQRRCVEQRVGTMSPDASKLCKEAGRLPQRAQHASNHTRRTTEARYSSRAAPLGIYFFLLRFMYLGTNPRRD